MTFDDWVIEEERKNGYLFSYVQRTAMESAWEAALTTEKTGVAKLHCSDGLSALFRDEETTTFSKSIDQMDASEPRRQLTISGKERLIKAVEDLI